MLAKLAEGDMIASEACYHEHCMTKLGISFANFPTFKKLILKTFRKVFEAIAVAECVSFVEDSLQRGDEVALLIKVSAIRKFIVIV